MKIVAAAAASAKAVVFLMAMDIRVLFSCALRKSDRSEHDSPTNPKLLDRCDAEFGAARVLRTTRREPGPVLLIVPDGTY